jgi:perosamine synthetase
MTNLQAALGIAQLERIEESILKKRWIGELYQEKLRHISSVQLPLPVTEYAKNIYWVFGIVINADHPLDAKSAMKELSKSGIGTRPFFWSLHEQPVLQQLGYHSDESFPVSELLSRRGFYLPSGLAITEEQISYVSKKVNEIFS